MTSSTPPSFSMGLNTFKVPKEMYSTNRKTLLQNLREAIPSETEEDYMVYIEGGHATTRNDSDHEPIFRQESYFHYLFGVREPDHCGALYLKSGKNVLFTPKLPEDYATIMGRIPKNDEIKETYQVDDVMFTDCVEDTLAKFCASGGKVLVLKGINSDSGNEYTPPSFNSNDIVVNDEILFPIIVECRVIKSQMELDLIRYCTEITSFAHVFTMKHMKPGMMEYQGESLFRHFIYYNFGARHVGYTSICGCGPDPAVLHYGHAGAPNDRQIQDGDSCLFDMGAEYFCYGSDVTCSFPVSSTGKFTTKQKIVYEGVLNAQRKVIEMIKPDVSYLDCHKAAEGEILKALVKLDIVKPGACTIEELVEMRLGAVFMPSGLGHLIGIDTHDVGGYLPGHQPRIMEPGLRSLRTSRKMKVNMTVTVEPGCYFIDHLIDGALKDGSKLKPYLNAEVLNGFRGSGGVRLEDVIAITEDGCENYTLCPRTINEVEHVMGGGKWPPTMDGDTTLKRTRLTATTPMHSSTPV